MQTTDKLECLEKNAVVNGIRLTYFERGMVYRGVKPTLLFVHATGFHARVWDKIINALGDFHSISVDQRGHGRSEKKKTQHWSEVITDTSEMIEQLDLTNIIAIGHSMGAHALIGAAPKAEHRFLKIIAVIYLQTPKYYCLKGINYHLPKSEDPMLLMMGKLLVNLIRIQS